MKAIPTSPSRGGMVIMEVLCALLVFGMAAVGLMKAITVSAQSAVVAQQELRMILRLQSTLNETSKYSNIEQLYNDKPVNSTDPDELGVWTRTEIIKLENLTTSIDSTVINDMYQVKVSAFYENFGQTGEMTADTVRYSKLYSTAGAAAGATPTIPQSR